jgi:hypothetical protein
MRAAITAAPVVEIDLGFIAPSLLDGGVPPCPADSFYRSGRSRNWLKTKNPVFVRT